MGNVTDSELVAACRDGDDDAWRALVERYSRYVYALCVRGFRLTEQDADDAFQEVFSRVWERLATLRDDDAFRPWLAQLTRRCCLDRIRAAQRDPVTGEAPELEAPDELARLDEAMDVRAALTSLSPECADVLDRFFCRDESYHTIADALGLPGGTIASRISRCLGKLREQLEGRIIAAAPSSRMEQPR